MKERPSARLLGDTLVVVLPYEYRQLAGSLDDATWSAFSRAWVCPATSDNLQAVMSISGIRVTEELIDRARAAAPEVKDAGAEQSTSPEVPMPIRGVVPFDHQVRGFNLAIRSSGCALLWEQGTGKSLATVAAICSRWDNATATRILIIAPLSVLPVWEREFRDYAAPATIQIPFTILRGSNTDKAAMMGQRQTALHGVVAVNYESMWREPLLSAIIRWQPDMVVCDESQRIKDPQSKQSKGAAVIGREARYRMILTGTPVLNSPLDFWAQYRFVDPHVFAPSYYAFRARHAIMGGYENHQVIGYRHLDELVTRAHSIASRVTKASALDLPETLDEIRYCELEPAAKKAYRHLKAQAIAELEEGVITAPQMIVRVMRMQQITGGWIKPDGADQVARISTAKRDALIEVLEELHDAGKKVVVFARFLAEISDIVEAAKKVYAESTVHLLIGATPGDQRGAIVEDFQKNPDCMVIVAQTAVAGVGITLTAADTAIFYSCDYSYANHEQAKARIHRIGQKNACTYIYMVAQDTIDEDILESLKAKKGLADSVVDDWRRLLTGRRS